MKHLFSLCIVVCALASTQAASSAGARPNFLFIYTDDSVTMR